MAIPGRSELFVADGNEVLEMKLVRQPSDIENEDLAFNPTMCHQIFGPSERIYGYQDLKVQLYFSAGALNPYLGITYKDIVDPKNGSSAEADNIEQILTKKLQIRFSRNLDEFLKQLANEVKFKPMGTLKHTFKAPTDQGDSTYVVYKCETTTMGLLPFHERLQTFIFWFIDAASYIDVDDSKWHFYLLFEKYPLNGEELYAIAGFATVYEYYAYPEHLRPRLSQMLIFPPFQHKGLGAELLHTIYAHYKDNPQVKDITVEDPSEELQSVRDYVDCQIISEMPQFQNVEPTLDTVQEAATINKINKKQARRVYEILRLAKVSRDDEAKYKEYRLEVKRRLNIPHEIELKKLKKLGPQEFAEIKTKLAISEEHRLSNLDQSYKELEKQYDRVIERLQTQ